MNSFRRKGGSVSGEGEARAGVRLVSAERATTAAERAKGKVRVE